MMSGSIFARRVVSLAIATIVATGTTVVALAMPAAAAGTLTVSTSGADTGNCQVSACATLGYALSQAAADDTILVEPGTYAESHNPSGTTNTVPASLIGLTIKSDSGKGGSAANTIIDATGEANGIVVEANGVTVSDLSLENATLEGILVQPPPSTWPGAGPTSAPPANITGVTISGNVVQLNDQGIDLTTFSCPTSPTDLDDCGEGIHLLGATSSTVTGNTVAHNVGGILVSDGGLPGATHGPISVGPAAHDTISDNTVTDNLLDCGITLPGHDPRAVATFGANTGQPQPALAGVYDNTVTGNTSENNGGAGILIAAPYPGTGSYNNTVTNNTTSGNGLPGVTMHSHAPLQDLNGNVIENNTLSGDGIFGADDNGPPASANVQQSAGLDILSVYQPVTGTVVQNNTINGVYFGVWMSPLAAGGTSVSGNTITVAPGGTPVYAEPAPGTGYSMVSSDGGVFNFGSAAFYGSMGGKHLNAPIVATAPTPDLGGYWMVGSDGGVYAFGDAGFDGSTGSMKLNAPIVGIAPTQDGGGYWLVAKDGGVFAFGDATFMGSMGGKALNAPIVAMVVTTDGGGYWLVASDGGIFGFGDATFMGSMGGKHLNAPIVGMVPASYAIDPSTGNLSDTGYWLVGSDGGIYGFGQAPFLGSTGSMKLNAPIVGLVGGPVSLDFSTFTATTSGYWMLAKDGGVFSFGTSSFMGSMGGKALNAPVVTGFSV